MSGLSDEVVSEGHDLVDAAEHEAQADPIDFKKVHHVGESGGSILSDDAASTDKPAAAAGGGTGSSGAANLTENPGEVLGSKLNDLKDKLMPKK